MKIQDRIRAHFNTEPFDAETIAKEVWRELEADGSMIDALPLIRDEAVRLRRERNRALDDAWAAEVLNSRPRPVLPAVRRVDPWETIAAARAGLSDRLRRLIAEGELQLDGRTVPLRVATAEDIDVKLEQEETRLRGLAERVQVLRLLRGYFDLGISTLGELL